MTLVEPPVAPSTPAPEQTSSPLRRVITFVLAAIGLLLIVLAFTGGEGDEELPVGAGAVSGQEVAAEAVERLVPQPNDLAVRQDEVGVDLKAGFSAELEINDTPIPLDQLTINEPLYQYFYRPGEDKEIERLPPGETCVKAVISNLVDPAQDPRIVEWCFNVA